MKGNDYDAAKIYFQEPGDWMTQKVTRDGEKLTATFAHSLQMYLCL